MNVEYEKYNKQNLLKKKSRILELTTTMTEEFAKKLQ